MGALEDAPSISLTEYSSLEYSSLFRPLQLLLHPWEVQSSNLLPGPYRTQAVVDMV